MTIIDQKTAFYTLPTRAWELLAGALTFTAISRLRTLPYQDLLGLTILVLTVFGLPSSLNYPGPWPLLPVIGAALIIHAGSSNRLLANAFSQSIGAWSYSLYLWHWPVLVALYIFSSLNTLSALAGMALTLILSILSYRYVEQPFRRRPSSATLRIGGALLATTLGLAAIISFLHGLPQRIPPAVRAQVVANDQITSSWTYPCDNFKLDPAKRPPNVCTLGQPANNNVLIWGDSHAEHLYPGFKAIEAELTTHHRQAIFFTSGGCPPLRFLEHTDPSYTCGAFNEAAYKRALQPDVTTVILISNWAFSFEKPEIQYITSPTLIHLHTRQDVLTQFRTLLINQVADLQAHGKTVILLPPVPMHTKSFAREWARHIWQPHMGDLTITQQPEMALSRSLVTQAAKVTGATVLDVTKAFCPAYPVCQTDLNGIALYKDKSHISSTGAQSLIPLFSKALFTPPLQATP